MKKNGNRPPPKKRGRTSTGIDVRPSELHPGGGTQLKNRDSTPVLSIPAGKDEVGISVSASVEAKVSPRTIAMLIIGLALVLAVFDPEFGAGLLGGEVLRHLINRFLA